jgi:general secretion pathway protein A
MSYYKILGFEKEPFSTSPDPDFLYFTEAHQSVLTNTLIELRLKRGLSTILGDVGTGKTTLSRKLVQSLKERTDFVVHCVLDPCFENEHEFLSTIARNFDINLDAYCPHRNGERVTVLDLKEALEKFLFDRCVIENKSVVLIIDEAQKLSDLSIEMLRVLLNYETNENKMLQLVLFGQLELYSKLLQFPNFLDRISFKYTLNPLGLKETQEMIQFRIKHAGYQSPYPLFYEDAIDLIHKISKGYPRKITSLCHRALKALVMKRKWAVDAEVVREIVDEDIRLGWLTPIHS